MEKSANKHFNNDIDWLADYLKIGSPQTCVYEIAANCDTVQFESRVFCFW